MIILLALALVASLLAVGGTYFAFSTVYFIEMRKLGETEDGDDPLDAESGEKALEDAGRLPLRS